MHQLPQAHVAGEAVLEGEQADLHLGPVTAPAGQPEPFMLAQPDRVGRLRAAVEVARHGRINLEHSRWSWLASAAADRVIRLSTDIDKLAIEAEADRLSGVYLRVMLLAQAQRMDLLDAGRIAVTKGLVGAADWALVREALNSR